MNKQKANPEQVAFCGLYCGSCKKYIAGRCPGCAGNEKATWCKIRTCGLEAGISTCAECKEFDNIMECKKFNNFMGKFFSLVFNSDRKACIDRIAAVGREAYAEEMHASGKIVLPRRAVEKK